MKVFKTDRGYEILVSLKSSAYGMETLEVLFLFKKFSLLHLLLEVQ